LSLLRACDASKIIVGGQIAHPSDLPAGAVASGYAVGDRALSRPAYPPLSRVVAFSAKALP
jgi:hypothetical protein